MRSVVEANGDNRKVLLKLKLKVKIKGVAKVNPILEYENGISEEDLPLIVTET